MTAGRPNFLFAPAQKILERILHAPNYRKSVCSRGRKFSDQPGVTLIVRRFARERGFVANPKSDRWHKQPTAMLGGVAIFLSTIVMCLFFVPLTREAWIVLGGAPSCSLSGWLTIC